MSADDKSQKKLDRLILYGSKSIPIATAVIGAIAAGKYIKNFNKALNNTDKISLKDVDRLVDRHNEANGSNLSYSVMKGPNNGIYDPVSGNLTFFTPDKKLLKREGISSSLVKHELGHATDPISPGRRILDVIDSQVMPFRSVKNNKIYKEELRAWRNARNMSDEGIDENLRDAALKTYRHAIRVNAWVSAASLAATAAIASRILYNRHKKRSVPIYF